jgi:hypothetical protein
MFDLGGFSSPFNGDKDSKKLSNSGTIEFVCEEHLYGVLPEPIPANKVLPEWYKDLEGKMGKGLGKSTVKRCMPFLDAMTAGWILPLPADTEVDYNTAKGDAEFSWNFDRTTVSSHAPAQIGGDNHPMGGKGVLKFHNYWAMRVPEGYSVLFTPPMNRVQPQFQVFSGIVDCDNYFNYINFPFIWTGGDFHGVLDKGTPVIQAIPFKRDAMLGDGEVRAMSESELEDKNKTQRILNSDESNYRNERWEGKNASRVVDRD